MVPDDVGTNQHAASRSQNFVDYERVAARYQQGRSLAADVLDRWRDAVLPYLPTRPIRVADVGAGTGIFAAAWPRWTDATVLALEPAAAMAAAGGVEDPDVGYVRATAEAIPLRDGSADVVWVSTALHHFADVDQAVREFARILAPGGRVLVRTHAPDRSEITWVDQFPGRAKWETRCYTQEQLVEIFGPRGFDLVDAVEVLEGTESYATSADWVERMRHADSMLTALSDEEVAEGLDTLRSTPMRVGRMELSLFVFQQR